MSHKVSAILLDVAQEYLELGEDTEDKRQLLTGAVSAWNIACLPSGRRRSALRRFMREYMKMNRTQTAQDYHGVEENVRLLMARKCELYPDVSVQIIGARLEEKKGQMYVEVATVRNEK